MQLKKKKVRHRLLSPCETKIGKIHHFVSPNHIDKHLSIGYALVVGTVGMAVAGIAAVVGILVVLVAVPGQVQEQGNQ